MRITIANSRTDAPYIRHARLETLNACRVNPHPELVEPVPTAKYMFAYDDRAGQPVGMVECVKFGDIYDSYEESPFATVCDLGSYCPMERMSVIRTLYLEPKYRVQSSLFGSLASAAVRRVYRLGARYAIARTRAADPYLNRLYARCGGERVGTLRMELINQLSSLFVFDLDQILRHRAMRRVSSCVVPECTGNLTAANIVTC